eukprot:CAMPEP_0119381132 /NCGR_PEP_ID=MMETSP1334-20130426/61138_1 /TAXON_ID=127549 /ORGANISM="Calcidiscus leptoporus, Strain RCC1130" /LENGTH=136 /DNA_ID=CAMNT_0007401173 /DNA_START=226 /DNA_END=633 /DNA_ORIENTATION=+
MGAACSRSLRWGWQPLGEPAQPEQRHAQPVARGARLEQRLQVEPLLPDHQPDHVAQPLNAPASRVCFVQRHVRLRIAVELQRGRPALLGHELRELLCDLVEDEAVRPSVWLGRSRQKTEQLLGRRHGGAVTAQRGD